MSIIRFDWKWTVCLKASQVFVRKKILIQSAIFLQKRNSILLDIKDAMQELNDTQEKLTAEVPRIVEQNKNESKRLSAMPQQAKSKKRGFFSRLFGKKENAVTTGSRLTQTEKMLTNLNQTVVAKHHQQSRKVVEETEMKVSISSCKE